MKKKPLTLICIIAVIIIVALLVKGKYDEKKVIYNISEINEYKYMKYKDKDNYGIMDRDGNIIVEAVYKKIEIPNPEKDVFICYNDDNESEVLNSKKEVLYEKYDKIEPIKLKNIVSTLCYEKSVLKYKKEGKYGLIDFSGKEIIKNDYEEIENLPSTEGKFLVKKNDKYGVFNINGKLLVNIIYDQIKTDEYYGRDINYAEEGFIVSNKTNDGFRYGYIDNKGKKILNTEYNEIIRLSTKKDVYLIVAKNGKYGLYKNKKQVIRPEYQSITYTDNGALLIERDQQFGIATLDGKIKVETKYSQIEENGIYLYASNPTENIVYTPEGNKVDISFSKYVYKTENEKYRIATIVNNDITYYGIENKDGATLVNLKYNYVEYAFGDYFIVEDTKEKYGVINSNGTEIVEIKYDSVQKLKGKNIIQVFSRKNKETTLYSLKMDEIAKMKSATLQNENEYVKLSNDKKSVLFDKDGNKIDETSEIVKKDTKKKMPEKIGEYKKRQMSLDDAYYEK